jgi:hypothetical protein
MADKNNPNGLGSERRIQAGFSGAVVQLPALDDRSDPLNQIQP